MLAYAPPGWNKKPKQIICKQCTAKQTVTLTCMTCTKTKPLEQFAKVSGTGSSAEEGRRRLTTDDDIRIKEEMRKRRDASDAWRNVRRKMCTTRNLITLRTRVRCMKHGMISYDFFLVSHSLHYAHNTNLPGDDMNWKAIHYSRLADKEPRILKTTLGSSKGIFLVNGSVVGDMNERQWSLMEDFPMWVFGGGRIKDFDMASSPSLFFVL